MSKDQSTYQWIENYLHDRLSETERKLFEKRLKEDKGFAKYVEQHQLANETIMQNEMLLVKSKLQQIHVSASEGNSTYTLWLAGLLVFMLVVGLGAFYINNKEDEKIVDTPGIHSLTEEYKEESVVVEVPMYDKRDVQIGVTNNAIPSDKNINSKRSVDSPKETVQRSDQGIEPMPVSLVDDLSTNEQDNRLPESIIIKNASITNIGAVNEDKGLPKEKRDIQVPCEDYSVDIPSRIKPTCIEKEEGEIELVVMEKFENYKYAIDDGKPQKLPLFSHLKSGVHRLHVVDGNGCPSTQWQVTVDPFICDFVIQPSRDILWNIDLDIFHADKIRLEIFDTKSGAMVYQQTLEKANPYAWDGNDQSGTPLVMGDYVYVLIDNGQTTSGHITIVR